MIALVLVDILEKNCNRWLGLLNIKGLINIKNNNLNILFEKC